MTESGLNIDFIRRLRTDVLSLGTAVNACLYTVSYKLTVWRKKKKRLEFKIPGCHDCSAVIIHLGNPLTTCNSFPSSTDP